MQPIDAVLQYTTFPEGTSTPASLRKLLGCSCGGVANCE